MTAATLSKKALITGVAALATATGAGVAATSEAHAAGGGMYNVRSGPGTNYPIIGTIHNPDCRNSHSNAVNVNSRGAWNATTASNGAHGWIFNDGWCL